MTGTIFMETLRRNWRTMIYWGVGIGLLGWLEIIILPDVESLQQMAELMTSLPPAMLQMFGGGDASFLSTPEGYLSLRFFSFMPVVIAIYSVMAGIGVTANEEDQGILDVVLSLPVPRWRVIVERFLAYSLMLVGILLLSVVGLWVGTLMSTLFQVPLSTLMWSTFGMLPLLLAVLAFTTIAATILRRRNQAMALGFVVVIGGYFLNTLGEAAPGNVLYDLRTLSVFRYYDSAEVIATGVNWNDVAVMLVVTIVLVGGAVWFFQRRDIGT